MVQAVWTTAHGHLLRDHEPAGRADLAARRPCRPDPRRVRAALVALAEPGPAAHRAGGRRRARRAAGVLARPQAPRLGARGARLRARVPAPARRRVADPERVPPGRARDAAAALRLLVPRRGPARPVRARRRRGLPLQGGDRARRRGVRALVRVRAAPPPGGARDRWGRARLVCVCGRGRAAPLQPRRRIELLRALRRGRRLAGRRPPYRGHASLGARDDCGRPLAVPAAPRPSARRALPPLAPRPRRRGARPRAQPALGDADPAVDPLPLHGRADRRRSSSRACSARHGCGGPSPWRWPRSGSRSSATSSSARFRSGTSSRPERPTAR